MCGVGAGSFASFPCQTDRVRKNRVGPTRLEIAVWQGRGAPFRAGNSQNDSKEVLGMAKRFYGFCAIWVCKVPSPDPRGRAPGWAPLSVSFKRGAGKNASSLVGLG